MSAFRHVVALAGGVGGSRLAQGLARALPGDALTVVVNTGDDLVQRLRQMQPKKPKRLRWRAKPTSTLTRWLPWR